MAKLGIWVVLMGFALAGANAGAAIVCMALGTGLCALSILIWALR